VNHPNLNLPAISGAASLLRRRLLRIAPAAEYISTSKWKLRELANNGQIPVVQPSDGSPFLFDVRDLDGWIERNKRTK
jgi:excisionase family DNA binding protein